MREDRSLLEVAARWALALSALALLASMGGGFLLLPVLVPAHVWAASRSRSEAGRIGWSVLSGASLALVAWAVVYLAVGESKPAIWLIPAVVLVATMATVADFASRRAISSSPTD